MLRRLDNRQRACRSVPGVVLESLESRLLLSAYTVTSLADDGGTGELRWAIQQANAAGGTNTINFKSGLTGTIALTNGALDLTSGNITINGPGAHVIAVSGNHASGVFVIGETVTADISGLLIEYGAAGIQSNGVLIVSNCTISGNNNGGISTTKYTGQSSSLTVSNCTISGNNGGGIAASYVPTTITNSTITGNAVNSNGGGIFSESAVNITNTIITGNRATNGGGIYLAGGTEGSAGSLTAIGCTISGNTGGGIVSKYGLLETAETITITKCTVSSNTGTGIHLDDFGTVSISNSTISGNTSAGSAGGISNEMGTLTVTNCTISGNSSQTSGGGIFNGYGFDLHEIPFAGTVIVADSTISNNSAVKSGGGIYNVGTFAITNSTCMANTAVDGGAIYDGFFTYIFATGGILSVVNSTIAGNSAISGGGIYLVSDLPQNPILFNTIIASNGSSNIVGTFDAISSNNLIGTGGSGGLTNGINGNIVGIANPLLGPLQNNGGPTETMALLAGSPAINHGNNFLALDANGHLLTTDQRGTGFVRIFNGVVDIGAYELQSSMLAHLAFAIQPTNVIAGAHITPAIEIKATNAQGNLVAGVLVQLAIATGPGGGGLFGPITATTNSSGIAIFGNVSLHLAGTYTLAASSAGITSPNSTAFTVSPAAASKLVFAAPPVNTVAGQIYNPPVVVYVMDKFGNIVRNVNSPVTLFTATGPGKVFGTTTVRLNNGAAIFSDVWLQTAGSYTLIAQDGSLTSIISPTFTVAPAVANKLVFTTVPAAAKHGLPFTAKISVEDAYGNVLTEQNTGSITLALAAHPIGSTLAGTLSAFVVNGIAVFNNLTVNLAGGYSLKGSDTFGIASATSVTISVS